MKNATIQLKIKQRLNKLASQDYDNLECWQIVEAFNKGQVNWCRRTLHGYNMKQEGDEASKRRIDDLEPLLVDHDMIIHKKDKLYKTEELPEDYFEWKRINADASHECCDKDRGMIIYLAKEANVELLLRDKFKQPSFKWGETFCTRKGKHVYIYTNNEFELSKVTLTYYRQPLRIQILNCVDPYTEQLSTSDVECEFKEDVVELLIDEAVKILAGDIESFNQQSIASKSVEENN